MISLSQIFLRVSKSRRPATMPKAIYIYIYIYIYVLFTKGNKTRLIYQVLGIIHIVHLLMPIEVGGIDEIHIDFF
jgi:hypothetical protein